MKVSSELTKAEQTIRNLLLVLNDFVSKTQRWNLKKMAQVSIQAIRRQKPDLLDSFNVSVK